MSIFLETIKMAVSNLWQNKLRTFLTVLGVVIGISSIIAMMTFIQGATNDVTGQLEGIGANKLTVSVRGTPTKIGVTDKNIEEIKSLNNIEYVSVKVSSGMNVVGDYASEKAVAINGIDQYAYNTSPEILSQGRSIYKLDIDNMTNVCNITPDLENELFGNKSAIGETVVIKGVPFTVVGVLNNDDPNVFGAKYINIPYTTAREILGFGNIANFDVFVENIDLSEDTQEDIENYLYNAFSENENAYSVFNTKMILEMFNDVMGIMNGILVGIASISLLVGGIGIMNMMLVSVSERTNEIGLRKSLGAKPKVILLQFVIESIIISIIGGIIGLMLGLGISYLLGAILDIVPAVTVGIITLAIGFSALIGLIFGYVPAKRAAKLNPIDALRSN